MLQQARGPRACAAAALMFCGAAAAAGFEVGFTETKVAEGLTSPTAVVATPDGRVLIAQQNGIIRLVKNDTLVPKPFAAVAADDYGERGLLGMALDTGFSANGYVYVFHSVNVDGYHNRVTRLTASGDTALPEAHLVLRVSDLSSAYQWSHNGGGLEVGGDGKLYIGVGDQEVSTNAQDPASPNGKILRINADGSIPEDNPRAAQNTGSARGIWAIGLRNPFKLGVDGVTGKVFANDIGWGTTEEINEIRKNGNYAWDQWEGPDSDTTGADYAKPVYSYKHGVDCAVMGGDVYRPESSRLPARYVGAYFFLDFCSGRIRVMGAQPESASVFGTVGAYSIDMSFDRAGNLYYVQRGYATGYTSVGTSAAFKITFVDSSGATGLRARAPAPRAAGAVLAWVDGGRLRVPAEMTAVTLFDLSGRRLWEARGLVPGGHVTLPANLRGVGRVLWRAR
jgi:glucose/arabinose dehydrogenase